MREEKKKSSEVTVEEFKGLQMLEKKKLNDDEVVMRVEKAQPKVKEANKKEEKAEVEEKEAAAKDTNLRRYKIFLKNIIVQCQLDVWNLILNSYF